jgi:hypothetical protein
MNTYYKPAKMTKGEYIRFMADKIENAIGINGTQFSYNLLSVPVTPEDNLFHKNISEIMLVLKDRGFKVWGIPAEGNDIYKFYVSL